LLDIDERWTGVTVMPDTGAEVGLVGWDLVVEAGWLMQDSAIEAVLGIAGQGGRAVLGRVVVPIRWSDGVEGEVELQVVELMPVGFPEVIVGRDSLAENGWSVECTEEGWLCSTEGAGRMRWRPWLGQ